VINIDANARGSETKMIDIQKVLVADHIQQLERDATPQAGRRRAPRAFTRATEVTGRSVAGASVRVRLGRWVVGIGEAIAGPSVLAGDDALKSIPNSA
jgi:hypothetical protein